MDLLSICCTKYEQYPWNLPLCDDSPRKLKTYTTLLNEHSESLFSEKACLIFRDLHNDADMFTEHQARSLEDVRRRCILESSQQLHNNIHSLDCRFVFVYSRNSREALFTTRSMLMFALSYHTVETWFLDFLFPFGEQEEPRDMRFSSIRHRLYTNSSPNLVLPELGRTGHELHLCFNLRAAETTKSKQMPWSVRQSVLYHSFDFNSAQALFIIMKGNDSFCDDFKEEQRNRQWRGAEDDNKLIKSFSSSLKTQLSFCWWSCTNWRQYINYLERTMKDLTNQAMTEKVQNRPSPVREFKPARLRRRSTFSRFRQHDEQNNPDHEGSMFVQELSRSRVSTWTVNTDPRIELSGVRGPLTHPDAGYVPPEIEFPNLQQAQNVEEKADEALYALKSNIRIVKSLSEVYNYPTDIPDIMQRDIAWFRSQLDEVLADLEMYQLSVETILKLFSERKQLLLSILEFQNMQTSKYLAEKAQISANSMEVMTEEMRELTQKTKDETVSMTVIAVVTMFFLPGTFVSTLMSTDIVQWAPGSNGEFELHAAPGARNLFLALTFPLMFVAFSIWALVIWCSRRQDRDNRRSKE